MKKSIIFFTIILNSFSLIAVTICQINDKPYYFNLESINSIQFSGWRYCFGDHPIWAERTFDDSKWMTVVPNYFRKDSVGVHWYRNHIVLKGDKIDPDALAILISDLHSAYEVYWDGILIGTNGLVGSEKSEEVPGKIVKIFRIKHEFTTMGNHVLAIRFSNHFRESRFRSLKTFFGYSSDLLWGYHNYLNRRFFIMGIYLTGVLLSFALFLSGGRQRILLIFTISCVINFFEIAISPIITYFNLSITYLNVFHWAWFIGIHINWILLNLFLIKYFDIPRMGLHIFFVSILLLPQLLIPIQDEWLATIRYIALSLYTGGLLVYAVKRKALGSLLALLGYTVLILPMIFEIFQIPRSDFLGPITSVFFIFCIILVISIRIKEQNRLHENAKLQSQRIETELLKKTIQPHFIMNTLVSIISLIGENPKKAVKLIKALAEEFRVINRISSEKLIPIREEINLCRSHLELMGYRRDARYDFLEEGVCEEITVPPMIFHTLVENGLTHSYDIKENGTFRLKCKMENDRIRFSLTNSGSQLNSISEHSEKQIIEGMGLKYVRARLEESFPSRWTLTYGLHENQWQVLITIKK
jgi:hypothetical protein